ncbi:hypothetical protein ACHAXT_001342 [Thalassiosira profunda]
MRPALTSPSPSAPTARRGGGRGRVALNRLESAAVSIFAVLLTANLVALSVHVWLFLPDDGSPGGGGLAILGPSLYFPDVAANEKGGAANVKRSDGSCCKKRVRPVDGAPQGAASESLREALSKDDVIRYDVVPNILEETRGYGVVHQLPSIPNRRRMIPTEDSKYYVPSDAVHNLTYFLEARARPDEEDRPLFIYNPMLLPLDDRVIDRAIISELSSVSADVAYVGVYRLSNFANCHGPGRGVPDTYQNYLGLALLDRDLNIVRDATTGEYLDAVIDLNQHMWEVGWSPTGGKRRPKKPKQYMQDCQLFAVESKQHEMAGMVLLCNEYAMPVSLERRRADHNPNANSEGGEQIYFKNTYGSGLQLTAPHKPIMIQYGGKNMHYFAAVGSNGEHGPTFLEMWPGGPHEVTRVDFSRHPLIDRSHELEMMKATKPEPEASYTTIDNEGKQSPLIDRDSGSACCVPIQWKGSDGTERNLLLGFSHRKTRRTPKDKYNYVSRVYAFEPTPPFDIVARSGFFCLGFAGDSSEEARQSDNEQVHGAANDYKLKIREEEFECPRIHFVTGIAEKMGDPNTVIVSYGVNDCYPRMIEVPKEFLVGMMEPR